MGRDGLRPNDFTFSIVISALTNTGFNLLIPQLHGLALRSALNSCVFVGSSLMRGYTDLGDRKGLYLVFDEILAKNVTSWNALILGYMELGLSGEARRAFEMMPEKNIISWTTLVNGYIRNKELDEAQSIFNGNCERNVVLWTVMVSGYVQNGKFVHALELFLLMLKSGTQPNQFTFSSALDACSGCSSLLMGKQVHSNMLKSGIPFDVVLSTALVDMYAKCGDIEAAFCFFESVPKKDLATWNSIIGGYARHGLATRALEEFERMINGGVKPDQITFVNVLSACVHGGLVEEGERHFNSMTTKYGIKAGMEHYACMVDLYGRAGFLETAVKLIEGMPFKPDVVVWGALLAACSLHSSLELGEFAAKRINTLQKDHPAVYSMLSKIHGEQGIWGTVIELRKVMKERRAKMQNAGPGDVNFIIGHAEIDFVFVQDKKVKEMWTKEETDQLFDLCERFDLRFVVIADRFPSSQTVEQLKDRYYSASRAILISRASSPVHLVSGHPIVKRSLSMVLSQTKQQERKDAEVLAEAKKISESRMAARGAEESELPVTSNVGAEGTERAIVPVDTTSPSSSVQFASANVAPPTSIAESASVATSPRVLRVYTRTYALDQMVQAASSSAGLRTIKRVEQTLQDLGVNLKPKVPTKAVCAEHLELRKEILTLLNLQKQLQNKEAEGSSYRDGSYAETPNTPKRFQRVVDQDRTFIPEPFSFGGERVGKRDQKRKAPGRLSDAPSSPAQSNKRP
ncbi:SWR1-complex protein 4 [Camellia lanceoleosa]|uniref:SWR1-complex protein 4 n=1 Tax=Camellia lanceoleosa TaxID=1840588 RepID=A0ACC0F253_9ERIC|nr:SWR1-complex protein 4 [Camellia lanceoleosa]